MREKAIEVIGLSYSYPDGSFALRDVSFSVYRGEACAIVGPNGAGKSTLLLHLNGILRGRGIVRICEEEIADKNLKKIRARVGMVFEDPRDQLFMPTVYDDLAFGLANMGLERAEIEKRIEAILKELKLEGCESRPSHRLSAGERKKASLATVLVLEPEVLVLDEPTANLDPGAKKSFLSILEKLTMTKVIATHDLELVRRLCSRVILLDQGRIIAQGSVQEILGNEKLLEAHRLF
ncbi:MAG: energy-coupling factor ABC transporter ATP-binding protein [Candidatus Aminicenantales bacterium]